MYYNKNERGRENTQRERETEGTKEESAKEIIMSLEIVAFRRRFIVVSRISMPVCSEKGTFHCLAHKEESTRGRDAMKEIIFPGEMEREKKKRAEGHTDTRDRSGKSDEAAPREDEKVEERTKRRRRTRKTRR